MNFFEDLGSGLGSLSLHDQQKWVEADIDDPMEVDISDISDAETQLRQRSSQRNKYNLIKDDASSPTVQVIEDEEETYDGSPANEKHQDDNQSEEHDSFLGILSPTALGARFALQPQKLLMAPPTELTRTPPQRKPSVDFEFDTSDMQSSQLIKNDPGEQSHVSSFAASENNMYQLGVFNKTQSPGPQAPSSNSIFDSHTSQTPVFQSPYNESPSPGMFANSIFNSSRFGYHAHSQPQTVIHHHHYYSEPQLNQTLPIKADTKFRNNLDTDMLSTDLQDLSFDSDKQLLKAERYDNGSPHSNLILGFKSSNNRINSLQLSLGQNGPYLPSPWDPRAVPAERLPYVFLSYLQLLTNTLLSAYALHILVAMVQAIRNDVSLKMALEANSLLVEIALCRRAYEENNCDPSERVPALEAMCDNWGKCMSQDPDSIGNRSLIGAHTLGVILNSLVEPLGLKVLGVFAFFIFVIFACNFAFGYFRARAYYGMANERMQNLDS